MAKKKPTKKRPSRKTAKNVPAASQERGQSRPRRAAKKSTGNQRAPEKAAATASANETPSKQKYESAGFPIVGVGASAGGLAALKSFFADIPADSGLAFVVVVHLSPEHESHLAELLQPHVKMPVDQVNENVALEPNRVYVIPPNANLDSIDTHLRLTELEMRRHERAPVDHFFRTLANTHDGEAIGVILTGTGSDGTLGLREIKKNGGLTVVQDPIDAEYDGMPQSAVSTGLVDLVLPLDRIPAAILQYVRTRPNVLVPKEDDVETDDSISRLLHKVFVQLRARTGRDFSRYKRSTILRRIQRRMQIHQLEEFGGYLELLRDNANEVRVLADDLLITVTNFFRDAEVFKVLEEEIIPQIFEGKDTADTVRIWSVGCATGEEAYSLAVLVLEYAAQCESPPRIQIFASDLHEHSLTKAREGFYPGDIETDVSPVRLKRFFQKEAGGYRIRKEVRELVVFTPHNLLGDPPFSRLDLISCRNLLIYLERDVQRDVIELFHYGLNPQGFLILGSSETVETTDLFRVENKKNCIHRKRNVQGPEPRLPVFPAVLPRLPGEGEAPHRPGSPIAFGALHQRMVEQYAPPSLLVSADDKVIHLSENAGRYLVHPGGELTTNIYKLVREALRIDLRTALHHAREQHQPASVGPIDVQFNGHTAPVVMHVRPASDSQREGFVLIIFEERAPEAAAPVASGKKRKRTAAEHDQLEAMETELVQSRQRLQAIIEEYETSQEEVKASNEELQSANEELRSTMEELETGKEELQSMNEELQTVNQENRHKVEELAQLTSDLQNLMAATNIATLFLDRELRIMRFTPQLAELFNVRSSDRGRRLSDLTHRLKYDGLRTDAQKVLDTLIPVEHELQDDAGRWFLTSVRPYRTSEDRIEGVVITFVNITARKEAAQDLAASEVYLRDVLDNMLSYVAVLEVDGTVRDVNQTALVTSGVHREDVLGKKFWDCYWFSHDDSVANAIHQSVERAARGEISRFDITARLVGDALLDVDYMLVPVRDESGRVVYLIPSGVDVTERKKTEAALHDSEQRLRLATDGAQIGIWEWDLASGQVIWDEIECALLGINPPSRLGHIDQFNGSVHPEDVAGVHKAVRGVIDDDRPYDHEFRVRLPDGTIRWLAGRGEVYRDADGKPLRLLGVNYDITHRKQLEENLHELNASLEVQVAKRTQFLSILQDITRSANQAQTVEEAMLAAMDRICDYNGWQVGHVWKLPEDCSDQLVNTNLWHITDDADKAIRKLAEFQQACERMQFAAGEPIVGLVAASGQPQWIDEIAASPDWRRGPAEKFGLHAVIAFPIQANGAVISVMEFFSDQPARREEKFMDIMIDVGIQLGHVIQRKELERQIADAAEREQRRIGGDIHDGVGQELTGLRYLAQTHAEVLSGQNSSEKEAAQRITEGLETVQRQLRGVIRDLIPVELSEKGLEAALRSLAERTDLTHRLSCSFEAANSVRVEDNLLATHLYRIAQEAVSNAVHHAQSERITIRLRQDGTDLTLEVTDDGIGIGHPQYGQSGFGLRSMGYRANLVGATLTIQPGEAGGTTVRCTLNQQER